MLYNIFVDGSSVEYIGVVVHTARLKFEVRN